MIEEKEAKIEGQIPECFIKTERKALKPLIDAIDVIETDTCDILLSEKTTRMEALSRDRVALIGITLPTYYFSEYRIPEEKKYRVDIKELKEMLKDKESITLTFSNAVEGEFTEEKLKILRIANPASFSISPKEFMSIIKGIRTALPGYRESVRIEIFKDHVVFRSRDNNIEIVVKYEIPTTDERAGLYDLDRLVKIAGVSRFSDSFSSLDVEIAESKILKLSYSNIKSGEIRYYLAPLVEE
jgi:hypothetical protein